MSKHDFTSIGDFLIRSATESGEPVRLPTPPKATSKADMLNNLDTFAKWAGPSLRALSAEFAEYKTNTAEILARHEQWCHTDWDRISALATKLDKLDTRLAKLEQIVNKL